MEWGDIGLEDGNVWRVFRGGVWENRMTWIRKLFKLFKWGWRNEIWKMRVIGFNRYLINARGIEQGYLDK